MSTPNTKRYLRVRIHVYPEFLVHPAIQAYFNSPYWTPIACSNGTLFIWPDNTIIEAVVPIEYGPWNHCLLFRSRRNNKIFITPIGEIKVPGGRYSNISKRFVAVYNADKLRLSFALVITGNIENACKLINASEDISYSLDLNYIIIEPKEKQEEEVKQLLLVPFEEVEEE